MLLQLKIKNLVLVDSSEISFEKGLNILTGETGAGKSAILSAIRLIMGARAETDLIGKNGEVAVVEALLSKYTLPDGLFPVQEGEPLLIRREVHRSGKNRCFVQDQMVPLNLLRQIVDGSIEMVDQSSAPLLASSQMQRSILDTYAQTLTLSNEVNSSFGRSSFFQTKIDELLYETQNKERDLAWAKEDLAFIEEVDWKQEEEDHLLQEHTRQIHAQDLLEQMGSVLELLSSFSGKQALLMLEKASKLDPLCEKFADQLKNALVEFEDVEQSIHSRLSSQDADSQEVEKIEERMAKIDQLKRRYGKSWDAVQEKRKELFQKIDRLESLDDLIDEAKKEHADVLINLQKLAKELSAIRKEKAELLTQEVQKLLHSLNLVNAQFKIEIQEIPLHAYGVDQIRFLFSANAGHEVAPIETSASGGELSRLLFAMKAVLCNTEQTNCLIFDEIDANVGGQTATILGEKLKTIAKTKQVICITHFVQVARFAMRHFIVSKSEKNGKTITNIRSLPKEQREIEYQRMLGTSVS